MGMKEQDKSEIEFNKLPPCVAEYIRQVLKKMRYRRKVRQGVQAELAAHFEDELKDCKTDENREQKAKQLITDFGDVKLLAVLLRRAKKRCRPFWRTIVARTFQAVGMLILCFIVYVVWFFSGKPVITTNYVAELNRIASPGVDKGLNAAPFYDNAIALYVEEPDIMRELVTNWPRDFSDEEMVAIENWINNNSACFEQIKLASEKPYYWQKYESKSGGMLSVLVPSLYEYRRITRLIVWRAKIRAYQGQVKDAFDDILMCYRLGMHRKVPTTLIEQLVGFSIEAIAVDTARMVLGKVDVDRETLNGFQRSFEKLVEKNNFTMQLDGEMLSLYDEIQRSFTDGLGDGHIIPKHIGELFPKVQIITILPSSGASVSPPTKQKPGWLSKFISTVRHEICEPGGFIYEGGRFVKKSGYMLFLHPDKRETYQAAQELHDYWENLTVKTPGQIRKEQIDTEKETEQIIKGNILLEMLAPALGRVSEITHEKKAETHALLSILALMRYNNDNGLYPEKLQELITNGYLKELPMDPYSDRSLAYKKTDTDFILYSVGPNFKDDGGELGKDSDGRVRKWRKNGDTVFWPVPKPQVKQ
jgi:hypothetical protein